MNLVLGLLILAANGAAPTDTRPLDAVEMYRCGFEAADDREYDGWPDGWTRKRGAQFPGYLPIRIAETNAPEGKAALRIDLNGGGAMIFSPEIEIKPNFSYVVEAVIKTESLKHDRAWLSVTFYDDQHNELATNDSQQVGGNEDWTRVRIGPVAAPGDRTRSAVIALHLEPSSTDARERFDLRGTAWFDDIWLARLPCMNLSTNSLTNVYTDPNQIEITCKVSGIFERSPVMQFEVLNLAGQTVSQDEHRLGSPADAKKSEPAQDVLGGEYSQASGFAGSTTWKPTLSDVGFYRLRVKLQGRAGLILERELTLAIVAPDKKKARGEFGWCLPGGDNPLSLAALGQLLPQTGIHWLKFPVWSNQRDGQRLDQIVSLAERLGSQRIEVVGLLANPPEEVRTHFGAESSPTAADIFTSEQDVWYTSLEPVLTRLSLQVRWWQLGLDSDQSFVGFPHLVETIQKVKDQLQQYGQEIHLGLGWRSINQLPDDKNAPWEFLALSARPSMTAAELSTNLPALKSDRILRWQCVQPLERDEYTLETRASDLVFRMLAAKVAGAEAIFVPLPFDAKSGLMNADGSPGELLLPWRTTALALSGAQFLGSLELPGGSQNRVFVRDGEVVMIAWNDQTVEESLDLGDDVREIDIQGRATRLRQEDGKSTIRVGKLPVFVTGLNEALVRWNMQLQFQHDQMPSICGVPHENKFKIKNFFLQGVGGQARIIGPEVWKISPRTIDFKLAAGEEQEQEFSISLPLDATSGRQPIRIDFDISADRHYQFSVYRNLEVGLDDLTIEATTQLNDRGDLEVLQQVSNHTSEPVSFKCMLYAPNRRRMMSQVIELRQDRDIKTYRLPKGEELIGQTLWLRAEELGGQRTLNFRFPAEK